MVALDQKIKASTKELKTLVQGQGSTLMDLTGVGRVVAARILADVGDVVRFEDRNRFASWTGTAPLDTLKRLWTGVPAAVSSALVRPRGLTDAGELRDDRSGGRIPTVMGSPAGGRDLGRLEFTVDQLSRVRAAVRRMLTGVDRDQAADVVLAVHEVAANSVVHGSGAGVLRAWDDGHQLVFEIENRRAWPSVPVPQAPTPDQLSGRGLWMARHLVDDVSVEVTADRAIVRLQTMRTRPSRAG